MRRKNLLNNNVLKMKKLIRFFEKIMLLSMMIHIIHFFFLISFNSKPLQRVQINQVSIFLIQLIIYELQEDQDSPQ